MRGGVDVSKPGPAKPPVHGTDQGYNYHFRWKELPPCAECREAHRVVMAEWRNKAIICRDCGQERKRGGRGRCGWCYNKLWRAEKGKKK
jgi:hypothetical protein